MATLIECPNCVARYHVPAALPPQGRKVRCAKCAHVWMAQPAPPEEDDLFFRDASEEAVPEEAGAHEAPAPAVAAEPDVEHDAREPVSGPAPAPAEAPAPAPDAAYEADFADEETFGEAGEARHGEAAADEPRRPIATEHPRRRRLFGSAGLGWGALAVLVLAWAAIAYLQRVEIVRAVPGMAQLYDTLGMPVNVRGLEFGELRSDWGVEAGQLYLEVRGEVLNVTEAPMRVPTVLFLLRDERGDEVFRWTADIRSEPLAAGDGARFTARIPGPSEAARSLQVRFIGAP